MPEYRVEAHEPSVQKGLVVGRKGKLAHVWVDALQALYRCHMRRQQLQVVCGDQVTISINAAGEGVVEDSSKRRNVFARRDEMRTKTIAANVDQVLGILAWDPLPSESLLMRWMIAADVQNVPFIMVVNKQDLAHYIPEHPLHDWIPRYRELGVTVVETSAEAHNITALLPYMQDKMSLFIGQSGAGKSSLINTFIPGLNLDTQVLSDAIGGGKHTTTTTQLYWLDDAKKTALIDSPGMQTFGLAGLNADLVYRACPDMKPYLGRCKFRNCQHQHEPECAFLTALDQEKIDFERWEIVQELLEQLKV